jgi:phytoene dehydrogenase-like protein
VALSDHTASMSAPVVIIGAGLAGLSCARALHRGGQHVLVLEREADVGGRVRSFTVDGCTIDRGFQVMFTAYPMLAASLDISALEPRRFLPGARIANGTPTPPLIGDGIRDRTLLAPTIAADTISLVDKVRLLALRQFAKRIAFNECFQQQYAQQTTRDFLRSRGVSEQTIAQFFAPFYGGILLDRSLETRASVLLYTFQMLATGDTIVPSRGMGAIAAQLASTLPPGAVRTGVSVSAVQRIGSAWQVTLHDGSTIDASAVVIATEAPAAASLAASAGITLDEPRGAKGCTTLWYRSSTLSLGGRALWLNPRRDAVISHAVTMTQVAPEYASRGTHLLAATALDPAASLDDDTLDARARSDLAWMAGAPLPPLERVAITRVPYAQYPQPVLDRVTTRDCQLADGLYRASETWHSSSLEGAVRGGLAAAEAVRVHLDRRG